MNYSVTAGCLLSSTIIVTGFYLLYKTAIKEKSLLLLASLFCLATGFLLLLVDVVLIGTMLDSSYIIDYLLFAMSAGDYGIAGRWILTGYVFCISGLLMAIYHYIFVSNKKNTKG